MKTILGMYIIVCSRGPGSETILTDIDEHPGDPEEQFGELGGYFADEGPVLIVPADTPDNVVYEAIKAAFDDSESESFVEELVRENEEDKEGIELMNQLNQARKEVQEAFMSAVIRSYLSPGKWTSCNAWRNLECELMSEAELRRFTEFTGTTLAELADYNSPAFDCKVLQESSRRLAEGAHTPDSRGC